MELATEEETRYLAQLSGSSPQQTELESSQDLEEPPKAAGGAAPQPRSWLRMLVFVLISLNDGLVIGYSSSLSAIFAERKVPSEQRSFLSIVSVIFMLRLVFAPFSDSHFLPWIGKRRTYLLPTYAFAAAAYLAGSFRVEAWVHANQVRKLAGFLLAVGLVMILNSNATQGLRLDYFGPEGAGKAAATQGISFVSGFTVGLQLFTVLNSHKLCTEYLGLADAVLSHRSFFLLVSLLNLASLPLCFLIPEQPLNLAEKSRKAMVPPWRTIRAFYKTKTLWRSIFWNFFGPTPLFCMKVLVGQYYIMKGLKREDSVLIAVAMLPVYVLSNLLWVRIAKSGRLMFKLWLAILFGAFAEFLHVFNYSWFDPQTNYGRTLATVLLINSLDTFTNWHFAQNSFFMSAAPSKDKVTYLSTLMSIVIASRIPFLWLFNALMDYVNMAVLFSFLLTCQIVYHVSTLKAILAIDAVTPAQIGLDFEKELQTATETEKRE